MDREYIKSQRVVERYLSGDLIVREAREFETYCRENPDVLATLPLPARLKARLSVKEFDGTDTSAFPAIPSSITRLATLTPNKQPTATHTPNKRDDDDDADEPVERKRSSWPMVLVGIAVLVIALLLWQRYEQQQQIKTLAVQAKSVKLRPPGASQTLRLAPSATLPDTAQASISLDEPKLLELHLDVSDTKFASYAVTIDKTDEARIIAIRRVAADTNRELRLNLNSSAFGAGQYQIKLEGYDWRGDTTPVGWLLIEMR